MDWIYEMELAFIACGCKGKFQTTCVVHRFRVGAVCWWNILGKIISHNEPLQLTWAEFLVHFKCKFCSAQNMLELENQFLPLKNDNMSIDEYTNAFTDEMDSTLRLVPDELTKVDKYAEGLPCVATRKICNQPSLVSNNVNRI